MCTGCPLSNPQMSLGLYWPAGPPAPSLLHFPFSLRFERYRSGRLAQNATNGVSFPSQLPGGQETGLDLTLPLVFLTVIEILG